MVLLISVTKCIIMYSEHDVFTVQHKYTINEKGGKTSINKQGQLVWMVDG